MSLSLFALAEEDSPDYVFVMGGINDFEDINNPEIFADAVYDTNINTIFYEERNDEAVERIEDHLDPSSYNEEALDNFREFVEDKLEGELEKLDTGSYYIDTTTMGRGNTGNDRI